MVGVSGDVDVSHLDIFGFLPNRQLEDGRGREPWGVVVNISKKHPEWNDGRESVRRPSIFGLNIDLFKKKGTLTVICSINTEKSKRDQHSNSLSVTY